MQILLIAIFGALGCLARYFLSLKITQWVGNLFPYGILIVNVLGCFLIGFLAMLLIHRWQADIIWRTAVLIGFLGGFTTFSSFTFDTIQMMEQGAWLKAGTYILLSVVFCLLATFLGIFLGKALN
jgi:CrcB protein